MNRPMLLIVDDEKPTREGLRAALEERYDVYVAEDSEAGMGLLEKEQFDVLLTDFRLPNEDGMKLIPLGAGEENGSEDPEFDRRSARSHDHWRCHPPDNAWQTLERRRKRRVGKLRFFRPRGQSEAVAWPLQKGRG